jgi:tRNA threonylcarbamoyladenosine biosynthesis protein TsaB
MLPPSPRLILAIDASSSPCSSVLWAADGEARAGGAVLASIERAGPTGDAALLPGLVAELLAGAGRTVADLAAVAVAVGPGSFTGLRASLAFAEGLAAGGGLPVIGVTVAEALAVAARAEGLGAEEPGVTDRRFWCALDARQGRLFLHRGGPPAEWEVVSLAQPPLPEAPVALTGDAAQALGIALHKAGVAVVVTAARQSHAREVAVAAELRRQGLLPPLAAAPLYIDPPRALPPRGGLRPPPVDVDAMS